MSHYAHLKNILKFTALCALLGFSLPKHAEAQGKLVIYCSVQNTTCEKVSQAFSKKYDVETQFVRHSTGTVLGKLKAEKDNPQADVWYGGTFEPHLQARDAGLLATYRSPEQKNILPQFKNLVEQRGDTTSIIYLMELGIGVNEKLLAEKNIKTPQCYSDLVKPEFKDLVQYPDPRVSGTGYSILTTLIETMGEDKAFDYLKALNKNISQYTKTGMATSHLSTGATAVNISFMHAYVREKDKGAPVVGILPCEGVGYTLGAASIIKNGRNLDNAKRFIDFVLSAEAQEIPWREADSYQLPTNIHAKSHPNLPDPMKLKLIDIDFIRFGHDQEAKRLIDRWMKEVKGE
ncbi:hypothetical protein BKK52_02995 [Rodentibacter trehalosifermentans]|uniref:Iron ABC transporter substrate-binding protein n=1 Tax=Rodentibacter trehalosifermentans TaxID=1908263 RepID=A0A1V3J3A8_9PAST|nr:ABC transporter substrate-binding protein [Rodentibacter trehalosifermentans]OOF49494.1 hypothetical protein BKK52_02995 [Rodentibacter trehalosifermentans]